MTDADKLSLSKDGWLKCHILSSQSRLQLKWEGPTFLSECTSLHTNSLEQQIFPNIFMSPTAKRHYQNRSLHKSSRKFETFRGSLFAPPCPASYHWTVSILPQWGLDHISSTKSTERDAIPTAKDKLCACREIISKKRWKEEPGTPHIGTWDSSSWITSNIRKILTAGNKVYHHNYHFVAVASCCQNRKWGSNIHPLRTGNEVQKHIRYMCSSRNFL